MTTPEEWAKKLLEGAEISEFTLKWDDFSKEFQDTHIKLVEQIQQDARKELEWLYSHCKIVCWPKDGSYPIEHNLAVQKDSRELLLAEFKKQL